MNDVGAALRNVGALDDVGEIALGEARPQAVAQPRHAAIREGGADAHPVELFGRLDLAQSHIGAVEVCDLAEARRQHRVLLECHRPDHADAARQRRAAFQRRDQGADRRLPAPRDLGIFGDPPGERHVIDVLDEQRVGFAGGEDAERLGRHRPARQPLHRGAEAVGTTEHQMVEAFRNQQILDRGAAPGHLAVAEARILRVNDVLQVRRKHQRGGLEVQVRTQTHGASSAASGAACQLRPNARFCAGRT